MFRRIEAQVRKQFQPVTDVQTDRDHMSALPDSILLRRFQQEGDISSFEALFDRHYDRVYGALFRLIGTRQEAEDLAQEVFLKLYQRRLQHGENVAGWLYRVATHTGYNALKMNSRRERREQIAEVLPASSPEPEQEILKEEMRIEVRLALAKLPERSVQLLILRQMGLNYQELAAVTGVAPGSVGTLLARAGRQFKRAYQALTGVPEEGSDVE